MSTNSDRRDDGNTDGDHQDGGSSRMTNMEAEPEATAAPVADWVFLEVMGHRSHYGLLSEVERFGQKLARIDVFGDGEAEPRETHFYSGSSIFSITPATEEKCRMTVSRYDPKPALLTHEPDDEPEPWGNDPADFDEVAH